MLLQKWFYPIAHWKRRQQSHDRAYFCICAAETKHLSVVVVQCIPKGTNLPNYSLEGASNGFNSFLKEHSCSDAPNLINFFTFFNIAAWLLYLTNYQHFFKRFGFWEIWFLWALFFFLNTKYLRFENINLAGWQLVNLGMDKTCIPSMDDHFQCPLWPIYISIG